MANNLMNVYKCLHASIPNSTQTRSGIIVEIIKSMAPDSCSLEDIRDLWPQDQHNHYPGPYGNRTQTHLSPLVSVLYKCATTGWEHIHREADGNRGFRYRYDPTVTRQPNFITRQKSRKPRQAQAPVPAPVQDALDRILGAADSDPFLTPIERRYIASEQVPDDPAPQEEQEHQGIGPISVFSVLARKGDGSLLIEMHGQLYKATPLDW